MSKLDLIILDDDVDLHSYYHAVFKSIPVVGKVRWCEDEIELSQQLRMSKPHLLICDIHMPDKNGPDILRSLQFQLCGVHIITLSCSDHIEDYSQALRDDGFDVIASLQKPLEIDRLYELEVFRYD